MKKIKSLILIFTIFLFALTGCGQSTISYEGNYWYLAPNSTADIYEEITYDVKVVHSTPSSSTQIKNDDVAYSVDGKYVIILTKENQDVYSYSTKLDVQGNYTYGETVVPVNDSVTSKTLFSVGNNHKEISTEKNSTSTTTIYGVNNVYNAVNFSYNYTVDYDNSVAKTKFTSQILKEGSTPSVTENNFKKYDKEAFIDNELMLFMPRAFKIKDKESFTLNFSTIDVANQAVKKMKYSTSSTTKQELDIKTFDINYPIDGDTTYNKEGKVEAVKVLLSIDDTFSGSAFELYYAIDQQTHRHRLIKAYTRLNDDMGYLEYTINSVKTKN